MTARLRTLLLFTASGGAAMGVAAAASLLVDGVDAKRITWLAVAIIVAVTAGAWHGWQKGKTS